MTVIPCPAKLNLLLNILGKRPDGFHELETVMVPIDLRDFLHLETTGHGIQFTCNCASVPSDSTNLVVRAARLFFETTGIEAKVRIHLEKHIPSEAGLGGGSSDAAHCLKGLNEAHDDPLSWNQLHTLAAQLGSDIPFFLDDQPALATGRGEIIHPLPPLPALKPMHFLVIHPGFGVPTAWAYNALKAFPDALHGRPGRAQQLIEALRSQDLRPDVVDHFHNAFEKPVFTKYPWLPLAADHLLSTGAWAARMTGSGSAMFAVYDARQKAEQAVEKFKGKFGEACFAKISLCTSSESD